MQYPPKRLPNFSLDFPLIFVIKANRIEITHIAKRSYIQGIHIGNNVLLSCTKISRNTTKAITAINDIKSTQNGALLNKL